jgi:GNAT superfamily N-acetyltransferase
MHDTCYTVRSARPDDLPLLPALERAAAAQFRDSHYPTLADAELTSTTIDLTREDVWVVVDAADQPVGFAMVRMLAEAPHLHELNIHPQHARQRLGQRLIQEVAHRAQAQGASALTLMTFADVPWNGPYYTRLGFRILDEAAWTPALWTIRHAEEVAGLPLAHRICMQLDL